MKPEDLPGYASHLGEELPSVRRAERRDTLWALLLIITAGTLMVLGAQISGCVERVARSKSEAAVGISNAVTKKPHPQEAAK